MARGCNSDAMKRGKAIGHGASMASGAALAPAEEAAQQLRGLGGNLLGKEVAGVEGVALHVACVLAPERERPARVHVPGAERSAPAPEHQQRALDPAAGGAVGLVVLAVERSAGSVL